MITGRLRFTHFNAKIILMLFDGIFASLLCVCVCVRPPIYAHFQTPHHPKNTRNIDCGSSYRASHTIIIHMMLYISGESRSVYARDAKCYFYYFNIMIKNLKMDY